MTQKANLQDATLEITPEGALKVSGILNAFTVPRLLELSRPFFAKGVSPLLADLDNVVYSDSAGLALLTAWLRLAKEYGKTICYRQMPEQMQTIAKVSGLELVLPWI